MQQPQKINPQVLRLLVIFPNIMNYILAIGVVVFIATNGDAMKAQGVLTFWIMAGIAVFAFAIYTTTTIVKKIRAGQM